MKIIKNGYNFPKMIKCISKPYPFSTRNLHPYKGKECNSILEIEEIDIKRIHWIDHMYMEEGYVYTVKCPICGNLILIDEKQLSPELKNKLKNN